jgi:hypothetical protein
LVCRRTVARGLQNGRHYMGCNVVEVFTKCFISGRSTGNWLYESRYMAMLCACA